MKGFAQTGNSSTNNKTRDYRGSDGRWYSANGIPLLQDLYGNYRGSDGRWHSSSGDSLETDEYGNYKDMLGAWHNPATGEVLTNYNSPNDRLGGNMTDVGSGTGKSAGAGILKTDIDSGTGKSAGAGILKTDIDSGTGKGASTSYTPKPYVNTDINAEYIVQLEEYNKKMEEYNKKMEQYKQDLQVYESSKVFVEETNNVVEKAITQVGSVSRSNVMNLLGSGAAIASLAFSSKELKEALREVEAQTDNLNTVINQAESTISQMRGKEGSEMYINKLQETIDYLTSYVRSLTTTKDALIQVYNTVRSANEASITAINSFKLDTLTIHGNTSSGVLTTMSDTQQALKFN